MLQVHVALQTRSNLVLLNLDVQKVLLENDGNMIDCLTMGVQVGYL